MRVRLLSLLFLVTIQVIRGQDIPFGTWRTHPSYRETSLVADAGDRVYGAALGGLYYYDTEDNSVNRLTTFDGFQAGRITALAYDQEHGMLLVGYENGNMDLYDGKESTFVDLTTDSQITGSRTIRDILPAGAFAYISTDYGIIKYDLARLEPRVTYREMGNNAAQIPVYQAVIYRDSLFAATSEGILAGSLSSDADLIDYRHWRRFNTALPAGATKQLVVFDGGVYAAFDGQGIYRYNGTWSSTGLPAEAEYRDLSSTTDRLIITLPAEILTYNVALNENSRMADDLITDARQTLFRGKVWIADASAGLLSDRDGEVAVFSPSGPYSSRLYRLSYQGNSVWGLSGGISASGSPLGRSDGYYRFLNGEWENSRERTDFPDVTDLCDVAVIPGTKVVYLALAGQGVLRMDGNGFTFLDDETPGSTLTGIAGQVIVPALATDGGGLWMLNYGAPVPLHFLSPDGTWTGYTPGISLAKYGVQLLKAGDLVWIRVNPAAGGGLVVFDPGTRQSMYVGENVDLGGLVSDKVNDMALDKDGLLWLATDEGVSVISNPYRLDGVINAVEPVFEGRPLLVDEPVNCVRIDGGNRKWFGTSNGAWLFNDRTDELIHHFTVENSPLPENNVVTLAVHGGSGEVFFGTGSGIVSYRADASEGKREFQMVKIFPNPVGADFSGTVGFTGLAEHAMVKITDSAGRLVYQTTAQGGTATWDLGGNSASALSTGMYLVWCATEDGEETYVGKLAIIR